MGMWIDENVKIVKNKIREEVCFWKLTLWRLMTDCF